MNIPLHVRWTRCAALLSLFLLGLARIAAAQAADDPWAPFNHPWFRQIGIAEGLPHSITTTLAQDSHGLIWIGSMGGLIRYDGYRMQVFGESAEAGKGLKDAYVRSLLALSNGELLLGTNSGGLSRFDPATNTFRNYPVGAGGTADGKIYNLVPDRHGGVWIATNNGLDHLDLRSNRIEHVATGPLASPRNFCVYQDTAGNLWLGNNNGLFVRYAGTTAFVRPPHAGHVVDTVLKDEIWAVGEDREGRLWVGSAQTGAVYRDTDGRWRTIPGFSGYQGAARQPTVRDFLEVGRAIWIGTDGTGVLSYTPGEPGLLRIAHDMERPSSLPGDSIRAMIEDSAGNLWVATDLGVARDSTRARTAFSILPAMPEELGLSNPNVRSIHVDTHGRVWLGLSGGRIDIIDLPAGAMRHLRLRGQQVRRDVQAFAETPDGSMWIGTQGIARVNPDTFDIRDSVIPELNGKPVLSLLSDGPYLLIGTYEGVYRYDTKRRTLSHFSHVAGDPGSLASDAVKHIVRVNDQLWYLTSYGISIADSPLQDHGLRNLLPHPDDPAALPSGTASAVVLDAKGRVWIGTNNGLVIDEHYRPGGPFHFRRIGKQQGLASNNVNAMLADTQGNLWLSMPDGLARVDGSTLAVRNLSSRDGLHVASYIYAAAARTPEDVLLFGGMGGLTAIRPYLQLGGRAGAALAVTSARVGDRQIPFGELPENRSGHIALDGSRSMTLDFALLDYAAPGQTRYSYRMEGLDDNWTYIPAGGLPSAIYGYLPHGDYTLHLRASTGGLDPHEIETAVAIKVSPRWYERDWFNVLLAMALVGLIFGLVHLRTLYLRRQSERLQQQIDEHTRELQEANARLAELASTDPLTGVYNRRRFLELAEDIRSRTTDGRACMLLLDLDRFKQINDNYGHLAGDAVIRGATRAIQQHSRQDDLIGRYGGEELVVCLPDTSLEEGVQVAERICQALAAHGIRHAAQTIAVTISAGVAVLRPGESLEQWLTRADDALYQAKDAGRNCCRVAP